MEVLAMAINISQLLLSSPLLRLLKEISAVLRAQLPIPPVLPFPMPS
jgi:hypothetical protein